jgi:glutathione S-transferase
MLKSQQQIQLKLQMQLQCIVLMTLLSSIFIIQSSAFLQNIPKSYYHRQHIAITKTSTSTSISSNSVPSWNEIENILKPSYDTESPNTILDSSVSQKEPSYSKVKPTLFRERHGWCPYSERVWLACEIKNIQYDTIYIENSGYGSRPRYFAGQTPQIRWEDGSSQGESMDLVRAIDSKYNNNDNGNGNDSDDISLYPKDIQIEVINKVRAFDQIFPKRTRPSSRAAFLFRYDGEPLWKNEFEKVLRETDELLSESSSEGPFFCGSRITAADIAWAPFLERYAAQLPCLHENLNPRSDVDTYPHLVAWYDAMDDLIPTYSCRVKGDSSSWRKVLTMAGYGNGGMPLDVSDRMEEYKIQEGQALTKEQKEHEQHIWDMYSSTRPWVASSPALEAASIMTRNRSPIVKDIGKRAGLSESGSDLAAYSEDQIDEAMRAMVCLLCRDESEFNHEGMINSCKDYTNIVKSLATYLDDRMCVPRDMSSRSAATIKRLIPQLEKM